MNDTPTPKPSPKASAMGALIVLVALGIAIWTSFAEIWPTSMIIGWQTKLFGGVYYVKLTFLLTLLTILLPMLGIQWVIKKMMGKSEE